MLRNGVTVYEDSYFKSFKISLIDEVTGAECQYGDWTYKRRYITGRGITPHFSSPEEDEADFQERFARCVERAEKETYNVGEEFKLPVY